MTDASWKFETMKVEGGPEYFRAIGPWRKTLAKAKSDAEMGRVLITATKDEVDAELRELGVDPVALGQRGADFVAAEKQRNAQTRQAATGSVVELLREMEEAHQVTRRQLAEAQLDIKELAERHIERLDKTRERRNFYRARGRAWKALAKRLWKSYRIRHAARTDDQAALHKALLAAGLPREVADAMVAIHAEIVDAYQEQLARMIEHFDAAMLRARGRTKPGDD